MIILIRLTESLPFLTLAGQQKLLMLLHKK